MSRKTEPARYVIPRNRWGVLESLALLTWLLLVGFVSAHHEPWADEAQAWLMARDMPWEALVSHGVRYEGSPALWHSILWLLIRLHASFFDVRWFGEAFAAGGVVLLMWFSPFPRLIRLLLPFTFFLAYQNAVVSRSYVLCAFLAFGSVILLTRQQIYPVATAIALGLLGNLSVHGFVLAVSLLFVAVAVWRRRALARNGFVPAVALSVVTLTLAVVSAMPPKDVDFPAGLNIVRSFHKLDGKTGVQAAPVHAGEGELPEFIAPASQKHGSSAVHKIVRLLSLITFPLSTFRVLGLMLFAALLLISFRSALGWLGLIPYLAMLAVFQSLYLAPRHTGIVFIAFLVSSWLCWPRRAAPASAVSGWIPSKAALALLSCLLFLLCCEQIAWTVHAARADTSSPYAPGPATARFLQENFHGKRIAAFYYHSVAVLPYFSSNIFENQPEHSYWTWSTDNRISARAPYELLRKPDYVVVSGWEWGKDGFVSADWEIALQGERPKVLLADTYRIVPFYEAHGYHETHRFCGRTWIRFSYAEMICDVILEPDPAAKPHS